MPLLLSNAPSNVVHPLQQRKSLLPLQATLASNQSRAVAGNRLRHLNLHVSSRKVTRQVGWWQRCNTTACAESRSATAVCHSQPPGRNASPPGKDQAQIHVWHHASLQLPECGGSRRVGHRGRIFLQSTSKAILVYTCFRCFDVSLSSPIGWKTGAEWCRR